MKLLFDLFPVILFFIAYQATDIYVATGVAIAATFVQVSWQKFRQGKVDKMLLVSLGLIVVFGGITIALRDPTFVKLKPTILYGLFACVLLGSAWLLRKNLLRTLLGGKIDMPAAVWDRLNLSWGAFFAALGVINLYVAFNFSERFWVNYTTFGDMGLMLVFIVVQSLLLAKHLDADKPAEKELS